MQSRKVGESALLDLVKLVAESRTVLCGTCWARYAHPCCPGSASSAFLAFQGCKLLQTCDAAVRPSTDGVLYCLQGQGRSRPSRRRARALPSSTKQQTRQAILCLSACLTCPLLIVSFPCRRALPA